MDSRSDVYGLGAILYCMLAGHPPFQSANATELLMAHVNTPPKPLSEISGLEVPADVDSLVLRCLAKNPDDRFSDAGQLAQAINKSTQLETHPLESYCSPANRSRRRRFLDWCLAFFRAHRFRSGCLRAFLSITNIGQRR